VTLDDLEGSKINVILFDVKYVENSNSYDVGHNGDYVDRHVGTYASPDNWRTCSSSVQC